MRSLAALFFLPAASFAQPVITVSAAPQPGDHCDYFNCSEGIPIVAGPDQYWDFTTLPCTQGGYLHYVDPDITPAGWYYPASTVCLSAYGSYYGYYEATPTSWTYIGFYQPDTYWNALDEQVFMPFPWTYGSQWEDPYHFVPNGPGNVLQDTVRWSADAYGVVRLPGGTELPVVGMIFNSVEASTSQGVDYLHVEQSLRFYSPNVRCYVGGFSVMEQYANGVLVDVTHIVRALDDSELGMVENSATATPLLWPDPVQSVLNVKYNVQPSTLVFLRVLDITGREMLSQSRTGTELNGGTEIDASALTPGTYVLQFISEGKAVHNARFVVE